MFQSKAKKSDGQNPKNRLRAVVAAGGGYIIDIQIFLVEKCHRLLEIKGFGHKFPNNLRIRASFCPHNQSSPCTSLKLIKDGVEIF